MMNNRRVKVCILVGLCLIFLTPGISAYFFYKHPSYLGTSRVNKGLLLTPPLHIQALGEQHQWKLILWRRDFCGKSCLQQLDKLSRLRLALGRKSYEVDEWLLLSDKASSLKSETSAELNTLGIFVNDLSSKESLVLSKDASKIFIANPDNYLVLSYAPNVKPNEIYADLKLLLNNAKNM